jgi:DNA-binding CsgD family transcriptional regulator/tetratricopeptide (TPR) repeat protein
VGAVLLERDGELHRLRAALDAAVAGRGRVVFVGGEAGIGKTALVEHFAEGAVDDVRVAVGRCDALATPRALGPFVDIAGSLGLEPATERDALLGTLIAGIRARGPALLVVEDAHWADDATIDLVAMLGRRAVDLRLLLVVTYREDEVGGSHPLHQALGNLATTTGAAWIGLEPLSIDAVGRLAEPYGNPAAELHALTAGNPFYVTETLAAPPGSLSTNVRLAVLARASRLSPAGRRVLDAVAVVPGRAEWWLLEQLCHPDIDAVDECLSAGVLRAEGSDLVFRHELARQVIEAELPGADARRLHRTAMSALVARPASDAARVAHHARRAGDDEVLARASAAACGVALARGATREAIDHGERGLALAALMPADDTADLKVHLSTALHSAARSEEAIALAHEAVEHWRAQGDARREAAALNALGAPLVARGRSAEGVQVAERAVFLLESEPPGPELAAAYTRLASLHMLDRDRDAAVAWGERAIALATDVGNAAVLGRALIETGIADVMDSRLEGLDRVRRGIDLGRRQRVPTVVALGLSQIGSGCGELRRYDLAEPALVEGVAFASEHNLAYIGQYMRSWLARCCFDLGRWDEAEAHAADVIGSPLTVGIARFVAVNTLGWLRARRGEGDVWPLLDEALEFARQSGHLQRLWPCAVARAEAGWLEGDLEPHVAVLEESLAAAVRRRHGIAVGELGVYLARAEGRAPHADPGAQPFASWIRGDHRAAAAGFGELGCPYEAASALAGSGDTADLRAALGAFQCLGATPAADRVADELRSRGVRPPAARPRRPPVADKDNPAGLTPREVEVLRLVAAGFTNPQIAAALYISRKTAEHHVSNILTRLGVATRAEAAAAAVRLGITPT